MLRVVAAAILFSTGGAAIKTGAFSAMQVASIRSGIAAAMLLLWFRGRARWRGLHGLPNGVLWSRPAAGTALVYAATLVLFVGATKLTTAASAIFLQSTAPLYVALLGPFLLGERLRPRDVGFLAAVAAGLALCTAGGVQSSVTAPDPLTGNVLGAICGLTWALTLIGFRRGERAQEGAAVSAVITGNLLAFAVGLPALASLPAATAAEWATLGYLGVFQIGVAYILLTGAVGELPALHVSLLLLLEPVLNPVWAWLVRGEMPGGWALIGGAIILGASAAQMISDARAPRPATS
jgi:DME family drug/metabolite transporter